MTDFNVAAVNGYFDSLTSMVRQLGVFQVVLTHEPKSPPSEFPAVSVWWRKISPVQSSGLASVSGVVTFAIRVYQSTMGTIPQNKIDPALLKNTALILQALAANFTLQGTARDVDLLGAEGQPLEATSGYIAHDSVLLRVADIIVPVVVNDLWAEVP